MPAKKKPYRTLAELLWEPTHFTRDECLRAVRKVLEEDRRAAETRRVGRAERARRKATRAAGE